MFTVAASSGQNEKTFRFLSMCRVFFLSTHREMKQELLDREEMVANLIGGLVYVGLGGQSRSRRNILYALVYFQPNSHPRKVKSLEMAKTDLLAPVYICVMHKYVQNCKTCLDDIS